MDKIESTKNILKSEFEQFPYVKNDGIWGHAGTSRKLFDYISACVDNGEDVSECKDWLLNLLKEEDITNNCDIELCKWAVVSIYEYARRHAN